jgi:hypothetical protein
MTGKIRLGCGTCDRNDFDFVTKLPNDWTDITEVRSYEESIREVAVDDKSRSPLDWQTHLGTCPDCHAEED